MVGRRQAATRWWGPGQGWLCSQKAELAWVQGEGDRPPAPSSPAVLTSRCLRAKHRHAGPERRFGKVGFQVQGGSQLPPWVLCVCVCVYVCVCVREREREREREKEREVVRERKRREKETDPPLPLVISVGTRGLVTVLIAAERIMTVLYRVCLILPVLSQAFSRCISLNDHRNCKG